MLTKVAKNVRIGDKLRCVEPPCDCIVTFVQLCSRFKNPHRVDGLVNSGLTADEAVMIEYRITDGDFKGSMGTAFLRLEQRIKSG